MMARRPVLVVSLCCWGWTSSTPASASRRTSRVFNPACSEDYRQSTGRNHEQSALDSLSVWKDQCVYIVTAAHVVAGDAHPKVEFFTKRNMPVTG